MKSNNALVLVGGTVLFLAFLIGAPGAAAAAADATINHILLKASSAPVAVKWYQEHLGCTSVKGRADAADCWGVQIVFDSKPSIGGSAGTGVDHIGFSFSDVEEKMAELEAVGVRGSGVRMQRFEDGATLHEAPGLFKYGFVFDPWGTRIEVVEDPDTLGFHHVHLRSADPDKTLDWYEAALGGKRDTLKGQLKGLRYGEVWLLVSRQEEGKPAATEGRSIDHIGFVMADLKGATKSMESKGVKLTSQPAKPKDGRSSAKRAFVSSPDNVTIALVEPGWAGVDTEFGAAADVATRVAEGKGKPYKAPRTPWGEPDLQGIFTANAAHGIPLERSKDAADADSLTPEEAAARRERGTLGSIWGYEREWRDTTLGYVKSAPSTQSAMVIDPPDGRIPPMTKHGEELAKIAAATPSYAERPAEGPEDLTPYVRCITRGLPGMMMPSIYNNGLQLTQGPGNVAIQKEMVHETRIIPTTERPRLGPGLRQWLGDPQGHWEGETLVVVTTNFNGQAPYQVSGENLKLTERFTLVGPNTLEYRFTVEDPTIWTRPWTGMFHFERDDEQYDLVEYACHEGNYGMTNILSGARSREREAAAGAANNDGR